MCYTPFRSRSLGWFSNNALPLPHGKPNVVVHFVQGTQATFNNLQSCWQSCNDGPFDMQSTLHPEPVERGVCVANTLVKTTEQRKRITTTNNQPPPPPKHQHYYSLILAQEGRGYNCLSDGILNYNTHHRLLLPYWRSRICA